MPSRKLLQTGLQTSALLHLGMLAALAWRVAAPIPLEIRAGQDSVLNLTLMMPAAAADPQLLDTPVVVTKQDVTMADHRMVEMPSDIDVPLNVPSVELARSLVSRLARTTPDAADTVVEEPKLADAPQVLPPKRTQPSPKPQIQAAAAAVTQDLGAKVQRPTDDRVVPPVFTRARPPVYPVEARQHGWTGVVQLTITVDINGVVTRTIVKQSSGYQTLDAAAVRAVQTWSGRPATRDGVPFESVWNKPIRFE